MAKSYKTFENQERLQDLDDETVDVVEEDQTDEEEISEEDVSLTENQSNEERFGKRGDLRQLDGFVVLTFCGTEYMVSESRLIIGLTIVGVLLGGLIGGLVGAYGNPSAETVEALGFPGELMLRALKMLVGPLIAASMIVGMNNLGRVKAGGNMGRNTVLLYAATTFIAVLLGLTLVAIIQPGSAGGDFKGKDPVIDKQQTVFEAVLHIFRSMVPENLTVAAAEFNVLGLIIFSIAFGKVLSKMPKRRAKPIVDFFDSLNDALMIMVKFVVWTVPFGVGSLICGRLAGNPEFWDLLSKLGLYVLTVLLGLLIHGAGILCLIFFFYVRENPYKYLKNCSQALLTGFGTGSSSATLPITIANVIANGVSELTAEFTLPLGATINMNGTALYEAVAAIFIAQVHGIELSFGKIIVISVTATLAAVGAAAIPEAGLVTMVMVLQAANLPLSGIELILAVDWFLDRVRTIVNIAGDAMAAKIVETLEKRTN